MGLRIFDARTGVATAFATRNPDHVRLYGIRRSTGGATTLTEARAAVMLDVAHRWLRRSHAVRHCGALAVGDLAARELESDLRALGCLEPSDTPGSFEPPDLVCAASGEALPDGGVAMVVAEATSELQGGLRGLLARYESEAIRAALLSTDHAKPVLFDAGRLASAEADVDRAYAVLSEMEKFVGEQTFAPGKSFAATFALDPLSIFAEALNDGFDTKTALEVAGDVLTVAGDLARGAGEAHVDQPLLPRDVSRLLAEAVEILAVMGDVLGLWRDDSSAYRARRKMVRAQGLSISPAEIEARLAERQAARLSRDFERAERIRTELLAQGVVLEDSKDGTTWEVKRA